MRGVDANLGGSGAGTVCIGTLRCGMNGVGLSRVSRKGLGDWCVRLCGLRGDAGCVSGEMMRGDGVCGVGSVRGHFLGAAEEVQFVRELQGLFVEGEPIVNQQIQSRGVAGQR